MASRKLRYYIKKRKRPVLTEDGRRAITVSNKMRFCEQLQPKVKANQGTVRWHKKRIISIPSSLVKKAVNCTDEFTKYYETVELYSIGSAVEASLLKVFDNTIRPGHQIISTENPWLSATPDGFMRQNNCPVEIKTAQKGSVRAIIMKHYHQLQFTMYCAGSNKLLLIVYVIGKHISANYVSRDPLFISNCLPRLEYSFYKHIFLNCDDKLQIMLYTELQDRKLLKFVKSLDKEPDKNIIKKVIIDECVTMSLIKNLTNNDIDKGRNVTVVESRTKLENGAFYLCRNKYQNIKITKPHREEVQVLLDKLRNMITKIDDTIKNQKFDA